MPFGVSAKDLAIAVKEIALQIEVTEDGVVVDSVSLKGLPPAASVSDAQKDANGDWVIPFAKLGVAKLSFAAAPLDAVDVEVVALGNLGGKAQAANAKFRVMPPARSAGPPLRQKLLIFGMLLLITVPVFYCWRLLYSGAQGFMVRDNQVSWSKSEGMSLKANPNTSFWYDPKGKVLHHRGPVDAKEKQQLLNLATATKTATSDKTGGSQQKAREGDASAEDSDRLDSYWAAIDKLTYESNEGYSRYFLYLLALAGLSGVLGTQVRSLSNFVFIATRREKDLDLRVWWPYYVVRPVTGFLLGLLAVLLVEAKLYVPDTQAQPSGTVWWMGIAMLIGFASEEFGQRLRLVAQALFGKEAKKD